MLPTRAKGLQSRMRWLARCRVWEWMRPMRPVAKVALTSSCGAGSRRELAKLITSSRRVPSIHPQVRACHE
jgi:hypothetical protein